MLCEQCGEEFRAKRKGARFCSKECNWKYWNTARLSPLVKRRCRWCGNDYVSKYGRKYCGKKCRQSALIRKNLDRLKEARHTRGLLTHPRVPKPPRYCKKCGKVLGKYGRVYCSDECRAYSRKNGTICVVCGESLPKRRLRYCSEACEKKAGIGRFKEKMTQRIKRVLKGEHKSINYRNGVIKFTRDELKFHLEKQFQPGMSWDNYGRAWHIDHKVPVSAFNLSCDEDIKRCWSLKNLQPLFKMDNLKKGSNLERPFQPLLI